MWLLPVFKKQLQVYVVCRCNKQGEEGGRQGRMVPVLFIWTPLSFSSFKLS